MGKAQAYGDVVITTKGGPVEANEVLWRLYKRDGTLTAKAVVKEAKRLEKKQGEASPLHPYFTWDVQEAAEKQWRREAQDLIRVFIIEAEGKETRAWPSIEDGDKRSYRPAVEVMTDDALYQIRLERMKRELEQMIERMRAFEEFAGVVRAAQRALA